MKNSIRYHLDIDGKRTTVSFDKIMDQILSIKLGHAPGSKEAHAIIRELLQGYVDKDPGAFVQRKSQYLQEKILLDHVTDKKLSEQYWDWRLR